MSTLKAKLINKKTISVVAIFIVIAIVCVFIKLAKNSGKDMSGSKSGFSNIYANVSTSAIKGYQDGVEEFLKLAENKSISFS